MSLIRELAVQAKIQMCSEPRLTEFAQLVARRCIQVCLDADDPVLAKEIGDLFEIYE